MALYDKDFLDTIALVSFVIGLANYEENLTQDDKTDIMQGLDKQTNDILRKVEESLEKQNDMLNEILDRLDRLEGK